HGGDLLRSRAVGSRLAGVERHRGDYGQARGRASRRLDGDPDLLEVTEGFEDEEIDATLHQGRGLLREGGGDLLDLGRCGDTGDEARGADRARHPHILTGRLASQPRPGEAVGAHLVTEAVTVQAEAVSTEGVRLDHLGARGDVVLVDLGDDLGPRDIELLEVLSDEDAALVEQGAHRPVEDEERLHGLPERGGPTGGVHPGLYATSTAPAGACGSSVRSVPSPPWKDRRSILPIVDAGGRFLSRRRVRTSGGSVVVA